MKRVRTLGLFAVSVIAAAGAALAGEMDANGTSVLSSDLTTTSGDSAITGANGSAGKYTVASGHTVTNAPSHTVTVNNTGNSGESGELIVQGKFVNEGTVSVGNNGTGGTIVLDDAGSRVENSGTFSFGEGATLNMESAGALFVNTASGELNIHAGILLPADGTLKQVHNDGAINFSGDTFAGDIALSAAGTGTVNTGTVTRFQAVDIGAGKLKIQADNTVFDGEVKSTSTAADAISATGKTRFNGDVTGNLEVVDAQVAVYGNHSGGLTMTEGEIRYVDGGSYSGASSITGGKVILSGSGPSNYSYFEYKGVAFDIPENVSFVLANEYATLQTATATSVNVAGSVIGSGLFAGNLSGTTVINISGTVGSDDSGLLAITAKAINWNAGSAIQIGHDGTELTLIATNEANVTIDRSTRLEMTAALVNRFRANSNYTDMFMYGYGTPLQAVEYNIGWDSGGSANTYTVTNGAGTFLVSKVLDEDGDPELWVRLLSGSSGSNDPVVNFLNGDSGKNLSGVVGMSGMSGVAQRVGGMTDSEIASLPSISGQANANTLRYFSGNGGAGAMSSSQLISAVSSYTGLSSTIANNVAMSTAGAAIGNVQGRLSTVRAQYAQAYSNFGSGNALASSAMNRDFRNRVWVSGFGLWEELDEKNGIPGYKYNSGGVMTGYDRVFGPITVGGSFGWTGGSFKDRSAISNDSGIDSYALNLYGTYVAPSGIFASLFGGYVYSDYDMKKYRGGFDNFNTPVNGWERSDYHGSSWSLGGEIGYDFKPTACLTLTPTIGLLYQRSRSSSFDSVFDWGGGNSTLRTGRVRNHSVSLPVALSAEYKVTDTGHSALALLANAGYAYEFHNKGATGALTMGGLNTPRIDFRGRKPGRSTWNVGGGMKYDYGRFEVAAKYDYYARSQYDAHRVMGTVGINF